jgi:hypothetical protein
VGDKGSLEKETTAVGVTEVDVLIDEGRENECRGDIPEIGVEGDCKCLEHKLFCEIREIFKTWGWSEISYIDGIDGFIGVNGGVEQHL